MHCNEIFVTFILMNVHIGKIIEEFLSNIDMTVTKFAERIGTSRNNVYDIFKREGIDTALLIRISQVLKYDFFQHFVNSEESKTLERDDVYSAIDEDSKKVILQIEIDEIKHAEILKIALGSEASKSK